MITRPLVLCISSLFSRELIIVQNQKKYIISYNLTNRLVLGDMKRQRYIYIIIRNTA